MDDTTFLSQVFEIFELRKRLIDDSLTNGSGFWLSITVIGACIWREKIRAEVEKNRIEARHSREKIRAEVENNRIRADFLRELIHAETEREESAQRRVLTSPIPNTPWKILIEL